jgi:hypothetical protein
MGGQRDALLRRQEGYGTDEAGRADFTPRIVRGFRRAGEVAQWMSATEQNGPPDR